MMKEPKCIYKYIDGGNWEISCNNLTHLGFREYELNYKYCPYCGKKIKVVKR